ncbi:MAG: hypothetical protein HY320_13735 [Armatimonadetes bacterium]|nr:hypothetical protein [Armatimonadota bacterium]
MKSAPAKPPRQTVLTEELQRMILAAAGRLPTTIPLKQRHVKIADALNVARKLVAQVLLEQQRQTAREVTLPEELQEAIRADYQRMVMANERPLEGRHRLLARQYNLTQTQLQTVLRPLHVSLPSPHSLTREQRFTIEKGYLARRGSGGSRLETIRALARELGLHEWQVARYIDMIHEDPRRLENVPDCSEEQAERIRTEYRRYLESPAPPEGPLHPAIGEKVGVHPKQVHKVLLTYRHYLRGAGG